MKYCGVVSQKQTKQKARVLTCDVFWDYLKIPIPTVRIKTEFCKKILKLFFEIINTSMSYSY